MGNKKKVGGEPGSIYTQEGRRKDEKDELAILMFGNAMVPEEE